MPKNFDAKNTSATGGKAHGPRQADCATCLDSRRVRVSQPRNTSRVPARQQYDIVNENCPDCQ